MLQYTCRESFGVNHVFVLRYGNHGVLVLLNVLAAYAEPANSLQPRAVNHNRRIGSLDIKRDNRQAPCVVWAKKLP